MKNLTDKALIVNITISTWSGRKFDRKVTREVNETHNTDDAGNFNKLLINSDKLSKITSFAGKIRLFHYDNTLPWSDNGDRLLPITNHKKYMEGLTKMIDEFKQLVDKFVDEYPEMKKQREVQLKDLYVEGDYPKPEEIRRKFDIHVTFMPIPDTEDFRVNLSKEEVEDLKSKINLEIKDRHVSATEDLFERAKEIIKHIVTSLSKTEKTRFHAKGIIGKVTEMVELFPALNYSGDANLTKLTEEMKSLIVEPENLSKDVQAKEAYLDRAKELEKMFF